MLAGSLRMDVRTRARLAARMRTERYASLPLQKRKRKRKRAA